MLDEPCVRLKIQGWKLKVEGLQAVDMAAGCVTDCY